MLIALSGMDGAGKSTQIKLLSRKFRSIGKRHSIIWARGGYTPIFEALKKAMRVMAGSKLAMQGHSETRTKQLSKVWVQKLWISIAIMDLIFLWGAYTRILRLFGHVVILDRYINDTLLDFRRNFPSSQFEDGILWKFLVFSAPKPSVQFVITIPVEKSIERSKLKNEPFPDSEATLRWRLSHYQDKNLFPHSGFYLINGNNPINEVRDTIQSRIFG